MGFDVSTLGWCTKRTTDVDRWGAARLRSKAGRKPLWRPAAAQRPGSEEQPSINKITWVLGSEPAVPLGGRRHCFQVSASASCHRICLSSWPSSPRMGSGLFPSVLHRLSSREGATLTTVAAKADKPTVPDTCLMYVSLSVAGSSGTILLPIPYRYASSA